MLPGRIACFFAGLFIGAVMIYCGLKYHVVRADDGIHFVPKLSAKLSEAYVDVRDWDITQWNEHRSLAAAVTQAEKSHLFKDAASQTLQTQIDSALEILQEKE
ncbi:MAG: hypothetical protein COA78_33465 [Blastopirellula sp.]|nr:MAG: hypothetical protein COA78_33465 [Blastopirellula sp.]